MDFCIWLGKGENGERLYLDQNRNLQKMKSSADHSFLAPFTKDERNYIKRLDIKTDKKDNKYIKYHIPKTQDQKKVAKFFLEKEYRRDESIYMDKNQINNKSRRFLEQINNLSNLKNNNDGSLKFKNEDSLKRYIFYENDFCNDERSSLISTIRFFFKETINNLNDLKKYIITVKYMFLGLSVKKSKNPWGKYKIPIEDCELIYDIFNPNSPKNKNEKIKLKKLGTSLRYICKYMEDTKTTSFGIIKKNDKFIFDKKFESYLNFYPIYYKDLEIITGLEWDLTKKNTDYNEIRDRCGEFYGEFITTKKFIKQYEGVNNLFINSVIPLSLPIDSGIVEKEFLNLTQEQKESIIPILNGKCSTLILTGGPGTGKSTVLLALRKCFIKSKISVFVLTFTGKASNRLNMDIYDGSDKKKVESMTIHRFYYKLKNLKEKIKGLLIIDEASTINIKHLYMISKIFDQGPIVMMGDPKQLQSIGQGRIFNRIINRCNFFDNFYHNELKRNFRAEQIGDLMRVVINIEKEEIIDTNNLKDVKFIEGNDSKVVDLYMDKINKGTEMNIILILTNENKDVDNINSKISKKLEPFYKNKGQIYYIYPSGGKIYEINNNDNLIPFGLGARIIFNKNKYSKEKRNEKKHVEEYFNGELATVTKIETEYIEAETDDDKKILCKNLDNFKLGYAITVYKSQGSETQHVIFYYPKCKNKNIKYVACSRSKETLTIVGDIKTFIKNKEEFELDNPDHFYFFDNLNDIKSNNLFYFNKNDFKKNNSYILGNEILDDFHCIEISTNNNSTYINLKNKDITLFKDEDFTKNENESVKDEDFTKDENKLVKNEDFTKDENESVKDELLSNFVLKKCIYCDENIYFHINNITVLHSSECNPSVFTKNYKYNDGKWILTKFYSVNHGRSSKSPIDSCNCIECTEKDKPINCQKCKKLFNAFLTRRKVKKCIECK